MLIVGRAKPTIFKGIGNFTLNPSAIFSNTSTGTFVFSIRTTKLYRL